MNQTKIYCGLCNLIITDKNKFVICEICHNKIHKKCKLKYFSDVASCVKCFECGGSIIKTICCDTNVSFDYLCSLTTKYYKICDAINSTKYMMLNDDDLDDENDKTIYYFNNNKILLNIIVSPV